MPTSNKNTSVAEIAKKEEKVTYLDIVVCDEGHYGSTYCGHCHENFHNETYSQCPSCNYKIIGTKTDTIGGGSDF